MTHLHAADSSQPNMIVCNGNCGTNSSCSSYYDTCNTNCAAFTCDVYTA